MARPARFDLTTNPKGKGKGKGGSAPPKPKGGSAQPKGKGKSKGVGKGKKSDRDDTQSREDKASRPDPKGPNMVPETWKNKEYEDISIVQDACPSDHHVAAYVQGTSDIPTFRVSWITSMGVQRTPQVSPNKFGDHKLTRMLSSGSHVSMTKTIVP